MPLVRKTIVIDPERRAEGQPTVGAARKHHVGCASSGRLHACQHINVIVSRAAGAIDRQEHLPTKSYSIYPALNDGATEGKSSVSVECGRLPSNLRVARAFAAKRRARPNPTTNKKVAVRIHVERSKDRPVRNSDRRLPGHTAVSGTLELHTAAATVNAIVCLVLEAVPRAVRLIDGKPFLVAAACASIGGLLHPCLAAVGRAPQVVAKKALSLVRLETEIEKSTCFI